MSTLAHGPTARRPIALAFRRTADDAVRACVRLGVSANAISLASIVASAGAALSLLAAAREPVLLPLSAGLCALRLWLNMLDGMVAISAGTASRRGEIWNDLPDRVSDVLVFAAVGHSGLARSDLGWAAAVMALLVAYVGVLGQAVGAHRDFGGPMSKPWRMAVLAGACAATGVARLAAGAIPTVVGLTLLDLACLVVVVLGVPTILLRLRRTLLVLDARERA
jgi:phosphatidylglycerophosphate synthase